MSIVTITAAKSYNATHTAKIYYFSSYENRVTVSVPASQQLVSTQVEGKNKDMSSLLKTIHGNVVFTGKKTRICRLYWRKDKDMSSLQEKRKGYVLYTRG